MIRALWACAIVFAGYVIVQEMRVSKIEQQVMSIKDDVGIIKEAILEQHATVIKYSTRDFDCLARNIYYEAGIEDDLGKYAVAQVTLNRLKSGYWGDSICDVVYAKAQFSWTKVKKRAWVKIKDKNWHRSQEIARKVLDFGMRVKPLEKSLFYHADYVSPKWRDNSKYVKQFGRHIFYTGAKGSNLSL